MRPIFSSHRGFTLIELMVTVAIIGILAAIAYPSYLDSVRKSRRADAKAVLLEAAQFLERHYTEENSYLDNDDTNQEIDLDAIGLGKSPKDGSDRFYTISFDGAVETNSFTLQADPQGGQVNDPCGTLTLKHTGTKGVSDADSGYDVDKCW